MSQRPPSKPGRSPHVAANLSKTRVYNRDGGPAPPGIAELGANVWRGDAPEAERGFVALGSHR